MYSYGLCIVRKVLHQNERERKKQFRTWTAAILQSGSSPGVLLLCIPHCSECLSFNLCDDDNVYIVLLCPVFLTLVLEMALVTPCCFLNEWKKYKSWNLPRYPKQITIIMKGSLYICQGSICRQFLESTVMLYLSPNRILIWKKQEISQLHVAVPFL